MDDLFTIEFKTHAPKEIKKKQSPLESIQPKIIDQGSTPYQCLKHLEEAIFKESKFPDRLAIHVQDLRDALTLEEFSKALSIVDLIEELFDLEFSD